MQAPSVRARRIIVFTAGPAAVVVAGLLIWQLSAAAFTAQTQNVGNNWATGTVLLSDDDLGMAAFSISNVSPGATGSKCLLVTSKSSIAGVVKVYLARLGADGLEKNITVSTEIGTGGNFGSCTGFVPEGAAIPALALETVVATHGNYATGVLPWATTGNAAGESKTYRVTWTFDVAGLTQTQIDALQGKFTSADVVWELQTN
jgi:hypothetical protein